MHTWITHSLIVQSKWYNKTNVTKIPYDPWYCPIFNSNKISGRISSEYYFTFDLFFMKEYSYAMNMYEGKSENDLNISKG